MVGKKFRPERVVARPGFAQTAAVQRQDRYEIKSSLILQPGPDRLGARHARERARRGLDGRRDRFVGVELKTLHTLPDPTRRNGMARRSPPRTNSAARPRPNTWPPCKFAHNVIKPASLGAGARSSLRAPTSPVISQTYRLKAASPPRNKDHRFCAACRPPPSPRRRDR